MQRSDVETAEKLGEKNEETRRALEHARRDYVATLRGTHRQKVRRLFFDEVLVRAVQLYGTRRQRRAATRAIGLRRRGRTHVP